MTWQFKTASKCPRIAFGPRCLIQKCRYVTDRKRFRTCAVYGWSTGVTVPSRAAWRNDAAQNAKGIMERDQPGRAAGIFQKGFTMTSEELIKLDVRVERAKEAQNAMRELGTAVGIIANQPLKELRVSLTDPTIHYLMLDGGNWKQVPLTAKLHRELSGRLRAAIVGVLKDLQLESEQKFANA